MLKSKKSIYLIFLALLSSLVLISCGGGGDGAAVVPTEITATGTVDGIAAAGVPMSGKVTLRDSSYPVRETTALLTQDGAFSAKVDGMKAPFMLSADGSDGTTCYSFAKAAGRANINPLTTLAVAAAAGAADGEALADIFENHSRSAMLGISAALPRIMNDIASTLAPLLSLYGAADADPFDGSYCVNHQGLDGLFDRVSITFSNGNALITPKGSSVAIFSAPLDALTSGAVKEAAIPAPGHYYLPGNAVLTLGVKGDLPSGTRIRSIALFLKLPLGVTADKGHSGSNTAIPVGEAAGANVYPAPSLVSGNTTLKLGMTSLSGFGAGSFVKVRLIFSTEALLDTLATDFSVTSADIFSDIYKNDRLKDLTIVPETLVFPTREGKNVYDSNCARCHTLENTDSVITPTLYNKTDLVAERLKTTHHKVTITATELENLLAYLTAYFEGQRIF
jgi:mono/diheme cytochrome c family protein